MATKETAGQDTITVTDNRTGKTYEFPVTDGTIKATDLRTIKVDDDDFGLMTYDPAFMNTASCKSNITFIDGDVGILRYRGYPIEQLAEKSSFLEVAYLLVHGELPTSDQLDEWQKGVTDEVFVDESIRGVINGFRYDAHPMAVLQAAIGGLSAIYPESKEVRDPAQRLTDIKRLIGQTPTIGAWAFRRNIGRALLNPNPEQSYAENLLHMMFDESGIDYNFDPAIIRALDVLLILHADHEQNCSTSSVRAVGSSETDVYQAASAGVAALYGPLHGGANEAVLRMLRRIGDKKNVGQFMEGVKNREELLMGFGHRVYKNYDPRAKLMRETCHEVLSELGLGNDPMFKLAMALEKIALEDEYFVARKLYPNVDFYSGIVQRAIGIPVSLFTAIFALARTVGWIAQLNEMISDPEYKIGRPRQLYAGSVRRDVKPVGQR